jgi:BlaI family transcriptional regulator, penicillinase repressor
MTQRVPVSATLSRRERQIMDVLYLRGGATVSEVMEGMPDPPGYSAIRATLRVLEEKGHVTHREDGTRYVYSPVAPAEEVREDALKHVVGTFFQGSIEEAVTALLRISDANVSDADMDRLQRAIRDARNEGR